MFQASLCCNSAVVLLVRQNIVSVLLLASSGLVPTYLCEFYINSVSILAPCQQCRNNTRPFESIAYLTLVHLLIPQKQEIRLSDQSSHHNTSRNHKFSLFLCLSLYLLFGILSKGEVANKTCPTLIESDTIYKGSKIKD